MFQKIYEDTYSKRDLPSHNLVALLCVKKQAGKIKKVSVINKMNIIIGDMKNSCILLYDDSVGIIIKQAQDTLYVKKFPLFEKPIDTTFLNLYKVLARQKQSL